MLNETAPHAMGPEGKSKAYHLTDNLTSGINNSLQEGH
jgi:hypothetical protein